MWPQPSSDLEGPLDRVSQAVNELVRAGLVAKPQRRKSRQGARPKGLRIDVTNVGEALEELEDPLRPA